MKTFKIIDCVGQILLIVGSVIYNLLPAYQDEVLGFNEYFVTCYLLVGGWQVMSVLVHLFLPAEYKTGLRRIYSILLVITALFIAICLVAGIGLDGLAILLFWSPVLAILYLVTCLLEVKKLYKVVI